MVEYTQNIPRRLCESLHFGSKIPRNKDGGIGGNRFIFQLHAIQTFYNDHILFI